MATRWSDEGCVAVRGTLVCLMSFSFLERTEAFSALRVDIWRGRAVD
jgi:hypothetical protein